jgi:hypothetical protein
MSGLWNLATIDAAFVGLFLAALLTYLFFVFAWATTGTPLALRHPRWRVLRRRRRGALPAVAVIAAVLGTYLAYGSVRNQMRMQAESDNIRIGIMFVEWERERPFLRCLYTWYSNRVNHETCRQQIVGSSRNFSEALLYAEEVIFYLKVSRRNQEDYHSPTFDDIDYWRRDIDEDPTGIFSFLLVNRYGLSGFHEAAVDAGLCIPDLCLGYERVRLSLGGRGFDVRHPDLCQMPHQRQRLTMDCQR